VGKITQAIGRQLWHPQLTSASAMERREHEGNCLIQLEMESGALGVGEGEGSVLGLLGEGMDYAPLRSEDVAVSDSDEMRLLAGRVAVGIEPQAFGYKLGAPVEGGRRAGFIGGDEDSAVNT